MAKSNKGLIEQYREQVGTFRALLGQYVEEGSLTVEKVAFYLQEESLHLHVDRDTYGYLRQSVPKQEKRFYPPLRGNRLEFAPTILRGKLVWYEESGRFIPPKNRKGELQTIRLAFDGLPENEEYIRSLDQTSLDVIILWNKSDTMGVALPADLKGARAQGYAANSKSVRENEELIFYPAWNGPDKAATPVALDPATGLFVDIAPGYPMSDGKFGKKIGSIGTGLARLEFTPFITTEDIQERGLDKVEERPLEDHEYRLENDEKLGLQGGYFRWSTRLRQYSATIKMGSATLREKLKEVLAGKCNPAYMMKKYKGEPPAKLQAIIDGTKRNRAHAKAAFERAIELAEAREAEEAKGAEASTEETVAAETEAEESEEESTKPEPFNGIQGLTDAS